MCSSDLIVLTAKDKLLNPLNYKKDSPVTPWKKRADEASLNRRMITEPLNSVEEEELDPTLNLDQYDQGT